MNPADGALDRALVQTGRRFSPRGASRSRVTDGLEMRAAQRGRLLIPAKKFDFNGPSTVRRRLTLFRPGWGLPARAFLPVQGSAACKIDTMPPPRVPSHQKKFRVC